MHITDGGVSKQFVFYKAIWSPNYQMEAWKSYLSHVSVVPVQAAGQQPPFLKIHYKYYSLFIDDTECKSITHVQTPLAPEQAALVPHIQSPL